MLDGSSRNSGILPTQPQSPPGNLGFLRQGHPTARLIPIHSVRVFQISQVLKAERLCCMDTFWSLVVSNGPETGAGLSTGRAPWYELKTTSLCNPFNVTPLAAQISSYPMGTGKARKRHGIEALTGEGAIPNAIQTGH